MFGFKKRKQTKKERILHLLQSNRAYGVDNHTLARVTHKFNERIRELRKDGYHIPAVRTPGKGSKWVYFLTKSE